MSHEDAPTNPWLCTLAVGALVQVFWECRITYEQRLDGEGLGSVRDPPATHRLQMSSGTVTMLVLYVRRVIRETLELSMGQIRVDCGQGGPLQSSPLVLISHNYTNVFSRFLLVCK